MHWPTSTVEQNTSFTPPFCPWTLCQDHRRSDPTGYRFRLRGAYGTRNQPNVPRFVCLSCRRSFSRQTFAVSYYLKRPALLQPIAAGLLAGSAHRQIARSLRCAPSTVTRLSARLGRHALLLLARGLAFLSGQMEEPVVIDHFETFEFTQDFPLGIATAVGANSWYLYGLDPAPHRRTGRRSPFQQRRLTQRPRRALKGGYAGSTRRLLDTLTTLPSSSQSLRLISDGHKAYGRVTRQYSGRVPILLSSFPNPKRGSRGSPRSPGARRRDAAMFPVDTLHGLLRHSQAHHRRETIAFGRRLNAIMERTFLAAVWRNFVKGRSERKPDPNTPAMAVRLTTEPWTWARVLSCRLFPKRESPPQAWMELYRRRWTTPLIGKNTRHDLRHAD